MDFGKNRKRVGRILDALSEYAKTSGELLALSGAGGRLDTFEEEFLASLKAERFVRRRDGFLWEITQTGRNYRDKELGIQHPVAAPREGTLSYDVYRPEQHPVHRTGATDFAQIKSRGL